jgi:DNA modification methylase
MTKDLNKFINKVITGDCMEILKEIPDNSIDTVITDPPYGLSNHPEPTIRKTLSKWLNGEDDYTPKTKGFMDKSWDAFVPPPAVWKEVFRVMKPGATILVFAGSRTYDLMTISLRLAGFEIKDTLMWLYGCGFPKATDISNQIEKIEKQQAETWRGYKTHGLKPAYEPIIMAIKPNDGSYAENALKWGVSGLNIDNARIEYQNSKDKKLATSLRPNTPNHRNNRAIFISLNQYKKIERGNPQGRFPANIIIDEETAKIIDQQSGITKSRLIYPTGKQYKKGVTYYIRKADIDIRGHEDIGGASRFFYCAKASVNERELGLDDLPYKIGGGMKATRDQSFLTSSGNIRNNLRKNYHPTVKPLKLIEYLCKLTKTPTGGIVLDPFAGSGTTGMACIKTNRPFILIEKDPEYAIIAQKRIEAIAKTHQPQLLTEDNHENHLPST